MQSYGSGRPVVRVPGPENANSFKSESVDSIKLILKPEKEEKLRNF